MTAREIVLEAARLLEDSRDHRPTFRPMADALIALASRLGAEAARADNNVECGHLNTGLAVRDALGRLDEPHWIKDA